MPGTDRIRGFPRPHAAGAAAAVACVVALITVVAQAQMTLPGGGQYGGDRLNSRVLASGERVTELIGNAYYRDDDVDATGRIGRWYAESRVMEFVRDVLVVSDSLELRTDSLRVFPDTNVGFAYGAVRIETADGSIGIGDRARYLRDDEVLTLLGDARVIDEANVIEGDSIRIRREDATIEAWSRVKIVDEVNRSVVEGEHAVFDRARGLAVVDSLPVFRSRRGDGPQTTVVSRWLSFDDSTEVSTAIGDVDFTQGDTRAFADTARFYGEDLLVLTGTPSVEQQARVMTGDEIRFVYVEGELDRIDVIGGASLVDSTPDTLGRRFRGIPLANTLTGDTLTVDVVDGDIVRTAVRGNAESVYLPDDQSTTISVNEVTGEAIDIFFEDNQVDAVVVKGKVEGIYRYLERRRLDDLLAAREEAADSLGARADSLGVVMGDSLFFDEPAFSPTDTLAAARGDTVVTPGGRIDFESLADVVEYDGESTEFAVRDGRIHISREARVKNASLELFAEDVYFDTEARELLAEGDPRLIDDGSELVGERMGYLFDPQTGAVADGATRFDDGFYTIEHARRIDKDTLLAEDAVYTQCELEEPHYHFHAKRMKLKVGERVVARQVTFYVSDIPLLALPFFYKDLKSGRRSGILFPQIDVGVNSRQGRFVRDLGYYWATNEYTDFKFLLDFNERENFGLEVENVYKKRYAYDGRVRASFLEKFESDTQFGSREWELEARHNQPELLDVWSLRASLNLASRELTSDLSNSQATRLVPGQLKSTARLSRNFESGVSLSFDATRDQYPNRADDDLTNNLQLDRLDAGFRVGVPPKQLRSGRPNSQDSFFENVLRQVTWNQSYSGRFSQDNRENESNDQLSFNGDMSLSYAPVGEGAIQPRVTVRGSEQWTYQRRELDVYRSVNVLGPDGEPTEVFLADPEAGVRVDQARTQPSLSLTNSLSSNLYGTFPLPVGALRAMRHVAQFSVAHAYRPQLGDKQEESQSVDLSWNNNFSFKLADGEQVDDEGNERTRNLQNVVTWNLRSSYDPDAEVGTRWSNINSTVSLRPPTAQRVNFRLSQSVDPYTFEFLNTQASTDVGLNLRGSFDLGGALRAREERKNRLLERLPAAEVDSTAIDSLAAEREFEDSFDPDAEQRRENERWLEGGDENALPWHLRLSGTLTRNSGLDQPTTTRARVSINGGVSLPGAWEATYRADFDADRGEFTNQSWSLQRPLHHWKLEFRSSIIGTGVNRETEFGFRLYLEPIPDLSVDRGPLARRGGFGNRLNSF